MKKKHILFALGLALLSTSCSDFLEEDPKGQLTPNTFFSTQDELNMATYALYQKVCYLQTNTNPTIPSWQGDDMTANPGSNKQAYAEVDAYNQSDANKGVEAAWSTCYTTIKAANYIIENADRTPTTQDEINIAIGQAKFWRAVCYFWLVRRWGDVPLTLDTEVNYERPLASVSDVYAQIVKDLTDCESTLPTSYSTSPRTVDGANVYITQQAAKSTLVAVYMAMAGYPLNQSDKYALAASKAKEVIEGVNNGTYEYILESEYKNVYALSHNYTNETVVGINYSNSFKWSEDSQMCSSHLFESVGGWGDAWGQIQFWKDFPDGPRKDATYNPKILYKNTAGNDLMDWWDSRVPEQHPMFCAFSQGKGYTDYDYTQPAGTEMTNSHRHRLIRYSEVLLWYAESKARSGSTDALAFECINKVRNRAGLADIPSSTSAADLAEAALKEHGWEVAGYFVALVTRRDDMLRMELMKKEFETRVANVAIEVAPGVTLQEDPAGYAGKSWQDTKSIYMPYPSSDKQLNSYLK